MYTEVNLDGTPRNLRFDIAAYKALEDAMGGRPLGAIVASLQGINVTGMSAALWAGFRHLKEEKLTIKEVDDMLDAYVEGGGDLGELARRLSDAMSTSAAFKGLGSAKRKAKAGNASPEPTESN